MIYVSMGIIIITILAVILCKKTSQFKYGYSVAEMVFKDYSFKEAIIFLEGIVKESKIFGVFDNFYRGLQQCMWDSIRDQIHKLNEFNGGDWYFDMDDYKFKDSLITRQILL